MILQQEDPLEEMLSPLSSSVFTKKSPAQPFNRQTSIQKYHQVLRERKNMGHEFQKVSNRIYLIDKIQQKIFRETAINDKKEQYKLKYRSLHNRSYSEDKMPVNIYRKPQPITKLRQEKENRPSVQDLKRTSLMYKSMIERNNRIENERKHHLANRVKEEKKLVKKTLEDFKSHKAHTVQLQIQRKISLQKKECLSISRNIQKLASTNKQRESISKQFPNKPTPTSCLFKRIV